LFGLSLKEEEAPLQQGSDFQLKAIFRVSIKLIESTEASRSELNKEVIFIDFDKLMGNVLFYWLEDILYNHLIILISVALEPGLIITPSNDSEIDFNSLVHVDLDVVFSRVDVVHNV
jgi:hypothetical protein